MLLSAAAKAETVVASKPGGPCQVLVKPTVGMQSRL